MRIGQLSRRLGVSDHVLRAWERRYGVLQPVRSDGGFRLYSEADEARVRRMLELIAGGASAAEAAATVLAAEPAPGPVTDGAPGQLTAGAQALRAALDSLDEGTAQRVLDELLGQFTIETVLRDVVIPHLRELGHRWADGEVSVAFEHFTSNILRGRLASLARGWGSSDGPRALLACPPGELHDLALLAFGIALNRAGWRVGFLGASTPIGDLARAAASMRVHRVVLAATAPERYLDVADELRDLAARYPLAIAGAGATPRIAAQLGATLLTADPVTAAHQIPA